MSNTSITLNNEHFTLEITKAFLKNMEMACKGIRFFLQSFSPNMICHLLKIMMKF